MKGKFTIWDLDNCLADDQWRQRHVDWKKEGNERYNEYDQRMIYDEPRHLAEFAFMSRFTTPIFFTGRRERWASLTMHWLRQNLHQHTPLIYMRRDNEESKPHVVKERMLRELLARVTPIQIVAAFDDVPSIVEMYRRYNIAADRLYIHDDLSGVYQPADVTASN